MAAISKGRQTQARWVNDMDRVIHVKLDSVNVRHVTTRTTSRLVWREQGIWYLCYRLDETDASAVYRSSRGGLCHGMS